MLHFIFFFVLAGYARQTPEYRVGDVLLQSDPIKVAGAVQVLTASRYNHVGLVVKRRGKLVVAEALSRVKYTTISSYTKRGKRNQQLRYHKELNPAQKKRLNLAARRYMGKRYDPYLSWSDERMYCSEMVQKVYQDALGVSLSKERKLRQHLMFLVYPFVKAGWLRIPPPFSKLKDGVAPNEIVVTPGDLARSKKLIYIRELSSAHGKGEHRKHQK